jgi:hypothetical protein
MPPPAEQLLRRQSVPARNRRHRLAALIGLGDDPRFLLLRSIDPRHCIERLLQQHRNQPFRRDRRQAIPAVNLALVATAQQALDRQAAVTFAVDGPPDAGAPSQQTNRTGQKLDRGPIAWRVAGACTGSQSGSVHSNLTYVWKKQLQKQAALASSLETGIVGRARRSERRLLGHHLQP